jgi:DNA-binding LacI/PurR family transcriptional regulator/serine phosphatase RsbU (regulator of sigma subunit)
VRSTVKPITIGVLSGEVSNGYSEPILSELSDAALRVGARLISFVEAMGPEDVSGTRPLTTDLARAARLDAVLVLPVGATIGPEHLAQYCERFRPLPICSVPDVAADWCSRVHVDNEPGMRAVLRHLIGTHGYRRVAFVRGPAESDEAELRFRVYREVLAEHGLPFEPELAALGRYILQSGIDAVQLFLDERKLELDAIACANDAMAFGVIEALLARGIDVPTQVAVVGFDDVDLARYYDPPLTTARQPLRDLGRTALEVLIEQLEPGATPQCKVLPSQLVVRESCGCAAAIEARRDPARASMSAPASDAAPLSQRVATALRALGIPGAPSGDWEQHLFRVFLRDIEGQPGFLRELRAHLHAVARVRGDVGGFHKVVTLIRQHVLDSLPPSSPGFQNAEALLHAARVVVSGVAERTQSSRQVRFEDFAYKLARTATDLGRAISLPAISKVMREHLPQFGISACYICLYDPPKARAEHARLIAGFGAALPAPVASIAEAPRFPTELLLPDPAFSGDAPTQYIVGPLTRFGHAPGYAVFARSPVEGFVYETLLDQLGGAIGRLELLERVLREAALREAAERERMERELAIARRIQTGILPSAFVAPGLDIAGAMQPASEVGGDYYEVLPVPGGCWLGIGDVAGHGLPTGLVMLMLQSVVSGLVHTAPNAAPRDVLLSVNAVLYENIRQRMAQDEHVTLTLLRCDDTGEVTFAGAHEEILLYRAATAELEWVSTPGTWVGARREIAQVTVDSKLHLGPGDVMLLYTDGVIEALDQRGEAFGPERLAEALRRSANGRAEAIRDAALADLRAWLGTQLDDFSILVVKRPAR